MCGCGGRHRKFPVGGDTYGIPRKTRVLLIRVPSIHPVSIFTTRSFWAAPRNPRLHLSVAKKSRSERALDNTAIDESVITVQSCMVFLWCSRINCEHDGTTCWLCWWAGHHLVRLCLWLIGLACQLASNGFPGLLDQSKASDRFDQS